MATETLDDKKPEEAEVIYEENKEGNKEVLDKQMEVEEKENEEEEENEAGVPFYQMAGSEFVEVLVGVGSTRIRDLFKRAKVNKPSVIFIDEIDALATRYDNLVATPIPSFFNARIC
ncbi:hypothetical protein ES319_A06G159000v1 [Gossypium barbadense]|uniref:ATPase AAA-type core domain-containing protein n=2 Tax=Gossypium TaxID=3633 RepID=A0A5J5VF45_GOSBA|nr:hypothetical protein ES319_A06G159000v1 [Gossypium barbadense]TYH13966.1 hypothetical protein ES288_A06G180900v1 [Gossypium darwinii]